MLSFWNLVVYSLIVYVLWATLKYLYQYFIFLRFFWRMPTVGLKPFIGSVLDLKDKQNMYKLTLECFDDFGKYPYFILWNFTKPYVILTHPDVFEIVCTSNTCIAKNYEHAVDWIGDGLVCSTGQKWKSHRRYLTGLFHQNNLNNYVTSLNEHAQILSNNIKRQNGCEFDFYEKALESIFKSILDTIIGLNEDGRILTEEMIENHLETVQKLLKLVVLDGFQKDVFGKWLASWTTVGRNYLKEIKKTNDFTLYMLREKTKQFSEEHDKNCLINVLLKLKFKDNLISEEDILDELNTFLFAGLTTTSATISWVMHHVAFRPDVQKKIQMEIKSNADLIGLEGGAFVKCIDDLTSFPYLDAVIKESQRYLSPVPITSRFVDENTHIRLPKPVSMDECKVKDAGLTDELPTGSQIILQYISLHRNKRIWGPDADEFKPERFLPENTQPRSPFAFLPFSGGARNCIGQRFAKLQMKIFLIHLLSKYTFSTNQDVDACNPFVSGSLEPLNGVWLRATENIN